MLNLHQVFFRIYISLALLLLVYFINLTIVQSWTKGCEQIQDIKQNRFFMERVIASFLQVFNENVIIWFLSVQVLAIKFKYFKDFLEIS